MKDIAVVHWTNQGDKKARCYTIAQLAELIQIIESKGYPYCIFLTKLSTPIPVTAESAYRASLTHLEYNGKGKTFSEVLRGVQEGNREMALEKYGRM